jgi:hypothetical protein
MKELPTSKPLVQRLHGKCGLHTRGYAPGECVLCDAADEIERLHSEAEHYLSIIRNTDDYAERLRAALMEADKDLRSGISRQETRNMLALLLHGEAAPAIETKAEQR